MLHSVIRSTPRWFDTTPSGRIVNRFSRDQETIDGTLSSSIRVVGSWAASLVGSIVLIAYVVPPFILPAAFLAFGYWRLSVMYIKASFTS